MDDSYYKPVENNINSLIQYNVKNISMFLAFAIIIVLIIVSVNANYLLYVSVSLIAFPLFARNRKFLLFLFIVLMLTIVGDLGFELRKAINIFCFFGMSILFFKDYGLDFKRYPRIPKELLYFLSLLYFSMIISSLFSKYTITGFLQIFYISLLFFLIYMFYSQIRSKEEVKYYILGILTSSLAMALSSIVNLIRTGFNFGMLGDNYHFRTSGIFANVNASAGYIAVAFPLLLISLFYLKEKKHLIIVWLLIIIEIIGVITLTSRGGMLSMICSSIFILYVFKRKYLISLTLIIIPTVLIILISPMGKMFELFFRLEQGLANRDELWNLSFEMIKHNLLFGVGPGGWGNEMFNYFPVMLDSFTGKQFIDLYNVAHGVNASHNFYLLFFTDMGIMGLVTSIAFPVVYFTICQKSIKKYVNINRETYLILMGAVAIGVGMFIRGFFEGISLITYGELSVDIPLWLVVAVVVFFYQNDKGLTNILPLIEK